MLAVMFYPAKCRNIFFCTALFQCLRLKTWYGANKASFPHTCVLMCDSAGDPFFPMWSSVTRMRLKRRCGAFPLQTLLGVRWKSKAFVGDCGETEIFHVFCVCSEKLRIRQASRRHEHPSTSRSKKKPSEPFFTGSGKNALVITGGWLVRFILQQ